MFRVRGEEMLIMLRSITLVIIASAWAFACAASIALPAPALADVGVTAPGTFSIAPAPAGDPPLIDGNADADTWKQGTHVTLGWDLRFERPSRERTDVYVLFDAHYLYVAFKAEQDGQVRATQHTDDVGFDTDDEVQVDLWPGGASGFRYLFTTTPLGTHYAHSSENSSYSPKWSSAGKLTPTGYMVTMRIPLDAMRGNGSASWLVQFVRFNQQSSELYVWSHQPPQNDHNDPTYAGTLNGMQAAVSSTD